MRKTGEILKGYREKNGVTAKDFAVKIGVSQTFYTKIENEQNKVSEKVFEILRMVLPKDLFIEILKYEEYRSTPKFVQKELESIEILEKSESRRVVSEVGEIPFFSDVTASAGFGCYNDDCGVVDYIEVPKEFSKPGNIAIKVSGDSMYPEIQDGDIAIVNTKELEHTRKRIMIVQYDDELYIKKIKDTSEGMFLESINPFYKDIEISGEDYKIMGRVVYLERKYC